MVSVACLSLTANLFSNNFSDASALTTFYDLIPKITNSNPFGRSKIFFSKTGLPFSGSGINIKSFIQTKHNFK